MTEPTDAEIRGLAATGNGVYQDDETAIWEITDPSLLKFARAVLANWGQPQAGAVPLTDEQIDALDLPPSGTATVRDLVRIIESAHGIGIKGGQHGTNT